MIFEKEKIQLVATPDLLGSPGLLIVYDQFIALGLNLQGSSAVIDFTQMRSLLPSMRLPWDKGFQHGVDRNSRGYQHQYQKVYPTYLRSSMNVGMRDSINSELMGNYPGDWRMDEELFMTNTYKRFFRTTQIKNWQTDSLITGKKNTDIPVLMFLTSHVESAWVQQLDGFIMKQWLVPMNIPSLEKEIEALGTDAFRRKPNNDGQEGDEDAPEFVNWSVIGNAEEKTKSVELQAISVTNYLKALNYFLKTTNE